MEVVNDSDLSDLSDLSNPSDLLDVQDGRNLLARLPLDIQALIGVPTQELFKGGVTTCDAVAHCLDSSTSGKLFGEGLGKIGIGNVRDVTKKLKSQMCEYQFNQLLRAARGQPTDKDLSNDFDFDCTDPPVQKTVEKPVEKPFEKMLLNVTLLRDMEKQVQENKDYAVELFFAPKIKEITGKTKLSADEIRQWVANPENQAHLQTISSLDLSNKNLKVIPIEIKYLTGLRELKLSGNDIQMIPPEIGNLTRLEHLELFNNQIKVIPPEIGSLAQLKVLNLCKNQIEVIPPEIGSLAQLEALEISNNKIKVIPPEIRGLGQLIELFLSNNQIKVIPPEIGSLLQLEDLQLRNNQIEVIPPEIGNLTRLEDLDLRSNKIISIDDSLKSILTGKLKPSSLIGGVPLQLPRYYPD